MAYCCSEASAEEVHLVGVHDTRQEAKPSAVTTAPPDAGVGQPKVAQEVPREQADPQGEVPEPPTATADAGWPEVALEAPREPTDVEGEVPEQPAPATKDVPAEPSSHPEPSASPRVETPATGLGPSVRPQACRAPRQARESPEVIKEIKRDAPDTREPPPQLLRTFVRRGDKMEVVED